MMNVILVDDEPHSTEILELLLKKHFQSLHIAGIFNDPRKALKAIPALKPDLLFLDIEMPHLNGFDLLKQLNLEHLKVIFTTAYDRFAVKAFKFNTIDYLLKPIDTDDLKLAINKVAVLENKQQISSVQETFETLKTNSGKIAINTSEGVYFVPLADIMHIESDGNYSKVYIRDKERHLFVSKPIKEFEELLSDNGFIRVHHSHIINVNFVERYIKGDGGNVILNNRSSVPISRAKKEDFLKMVGLS